MFGIKNSHRLCRFSLFILVILPAFIAACSQDPAPDESRDSEIAGFAAATEILRACKYSNGDFCAEKCCKAEENCEDGSPAYKECDLKEGEWVNKDYSDSECSSECGTASGAANPEAGAENKKANGNQAPKSCPEGWKCRSSFERIYRNSDCSFGETEKCSTRCVNDTCASYCTPDSFSCRNDILRKCDENGRDWVYFMACDDRCINNTCINQVILLANTSQTNQSQAANQTGNSTQQQNICGSACFSIIDFHYDASGNDCNNLNDEYVTFKNNCAFSCDLTGWNVSDNANVDHSYIFPSFVLAKDNIFTLYTGAGTGTVSQLYWNSRYTPCKAVWNNDGDTLYLKNTNNELVIEHTY